MKFENQICNGCNRTFQKDDDIVVCPICGTPQHRSCFELNNGCVNKDKHEDGFEWKSTETAESTKEREDSFNTQQEGRKPFSPFSLDNDSEALQFDNVVETRVQSLAPGITEAQRKEILCGHSISDTIAFIGNNASSYVTKFRKRENQNKKTFNFGAFLFCPIWFFWRRLYKAGIVYLAITICLSLLMASPYETYMNILNAIASSGAEVISDAQYAQLAEAIVPIMLYTAAVFILRLIAGFSGDKMYHKYCTRTLFEIDHLKEHADNDTLLGFYLKKSSTALLATLISILAYYFLPDLLMSLFAAI